MARSLAFSGNGRYLREAVIHSALGDKNLRSVPLAAQTLTPRVALHLGMYLLPVQVEHADGDGAGRPVYVGDRRAIVGARATATILT